MFIGSHEHSIDAKGRISLPVRFREILQAEQDMRLVITTNMDPDAHCLALYPMKWWEELTAKLFNLSPFDPDVIRFKRLVIASATEVQLDRQGRVLVPPHLRRYASLEQKVIWAGMGNSIELWDAPLWEAEHAAVRKDLARISHTLANGRPEK